MKKLVLALLLMLLQLCTACSGTTYHSNEEIGMAFQRHKSTFENVAVTAVGENSGYIHKPDAEGQETECGDSGCKLQQRQNEVDHEPHKGHTIDFTFPNFRFAGHRLKRLKFKNTLFFRLSRN